jgi:hypothetical protein
MTKKMKCNEIRPKLTQDVEERERIRVLKSLAKERRLVPFYFLGHMESINATSTEDKGKRRLKDLTLGENTHKP